MIFDVFSTPFGAQLKKLFEFLPETQSPLVDMLIDNAYGIWYEDALGQSWGGQYVSALKVTYAGTSRNVAWVYIDEKEIDPQSKKPFSMFALMTEEGMKSFSIKEAILKSAKRFHTRKDGVRYVIIPLRWRTPSRDKSQKPSSGFNFTGTMPRDAYRLAKSGAKVTGAKYGNMAGLKRYDNASGGHGQYYTFRAVSENSHGWQHPGVSARPVFAKAKEKVERMIARELDAYVQGLVARIQGGMVRG
jgi:hypothetical protein